MNRKYYSVRTGKNPQAGGLDLATFAKFFYLTYQDMVTVGYFQEYFGYWCVDGEVSGKLGYNVADKLHRDLKKEMPWPFPERFSGLSEEDLFDLIEFLFEHVSKPIDGYCHQYSDCGWHYQTFDIKAGQQYFREQLNKILEDYKTGYELSELGEILELALAGAAPLFEASLPSDDSNVTEKVRLATTKFRRAKSSISDRRDAIRELADVLEYLRPKIQEILTKKDEGDLFNIANNFAIRHHNKHQKNDYDASIWLSWMFYFFLATIHAVLRILERESKKD